MDNKGVVAWLVTHKADKKTYVEAIAVGGVYGDQAEERAKHIAKLYGGTVEPLYKGTNSVK